jgi:predicted translin family RNA/ssDNA-binding protein
MTCEILQYFILPLEDYLLGLSDLTGELMRFAISGISRRGGRSKASDVCAFVRRCKAGKLCFQFTGQYFLRGTAQTWNV